MIGLMFESVVVATVFFFVGTGAIEYYATKYDHLDIEQILNNRRMVNYYAQCLLSKGPCPPQGVEFKRILPEALETNCLRCTEKQKTVTYRTIKRLKKEYPKIWVELEAKWDPDHIYVNKFEETFRLSQLPPPSENEISLDDRFGVVNETPVKSTTVKTTTKFIPKKTKKPKYPPATTPGTKPSTAYILPSKSTTNAINFNIYRSTTTSRPKPIVSHLGSASESHIQGLTPLNPNAGGPLGGNKVGSGPSTDDFSANTESPSTVYMQDATTQLFTSNVNIDPDLVSTLLAQSVHSIKPGSTYETTISTLNNEITNSLQNIQSRSTTPVSKNSPADDNDFASDSAASDVHINEVSVTSLQPLTHETQNNLIFDLPLSSLNHSQTKISLQKLPSTSSSRIRSTTTTRRPLMINRFHNLINNNRQPDVISQLISTFLSNNKPPSVSFQAPFLQNDIKDQGRKPGPHDRLPTRSASINRPINRDPLRNFVRGITTAGDRLVETGTSIADSVLSSVRTLFTPPGRANRVTRRRI